MKKVIAPIAVEPRLLAVKVAAQYLGTTIWQMRTLVWSKKIRHVRFGKRILFDRADLDRYVEEQLKQAA
jgi:excisionase family DNA binding protein